MFNRDLKSRGFILLPISGYYWNTTCTPANSGSEQSVELAKWVEGSTVDQAGGGDQSSGLETQDLAQTKAGEVSR